MDMGLDDRPYWRERQQSGDHYGAGGGGFRTVTGGLPKPPPVVKWLLLANIAAFVLQAFSGVQEWFAAVPAAWWQIWRYLTFQFLHADPIHLGFNMLGLYFLGMILEQAWGGRRFLVFYLGCGAFAGLCHVVITLAFQPWGATVRLIGASGGVYAIVLACAILFPHIKLVLLFFLVPIRFAALLFIGFAAYSVLSGIAHGHQGGGVAHAAHLGGAVAAAFYIWVLPRLTRATADARTKRQEGAWRRKLERQAAERAEVDRILDKVRDHGINSLTAKEKSTLQDATRRQREEGR